MPQQGQIPQGQTATLDPVYVTEPIDPAGLCDAQYLLAAMLPIFAKGMTSYAGKLVSPQAWVERGMRQVFDWWCSAGVGCGEPDMIDAAADVAWMVASHVYPEVTVLQAAFDRITPYMVGKVGNCKGRLTTSFDPVDS
jgi:hypothetical protein